MRPDRAVVKKAIDDAGKNLSRAASLLGCTRQTLYTWIYQHGLDRHAGIRMDTRDGLDTRQRIDTRIGKVKKTGVYSSGADGPTFSSVNADTLIPVTIKVPQSLWKKAKKKAVDEDRTVSDVVTESLETALANGTGRRGDE